MSNENPVAEEKDSVKEKRKTTKQTFAPGKKEKPIQKKQRSFLPVTPTESENWCCAGTAYVRHPSTFAEAIDTKIHRKGFEGSRC